MAGTGDTSIKSYNYFLDVTVTNGAYTTPYIFIDSMNGVNFLSNTIMFCNDGAVSILFSLDGVSDHGKVLTGEKLTQDFRRIKKIWLRNDGANCPLRFWAY